MSTNHVEQLKQIHGIGKKRLEAITTKLAAMNQSVADLYRMQPEEIKKLFGLPIHVAQAIANANIQTSQNIKSNPLEIKGIKSITLTSADYPQRLKQVLGHKAPQLLYSWGNLDLLNKPAVGFCGSRNVTEKGLEITADTAQQITELGWVVVSGHARGVDTTAHRTALENGGSTILVLAEGILNFKLRQELKAIAKPEQLLIISEFAPDTKWTVGRAMQRNKTIIGLSDAMILVEARKEGGTFEAGQTALRLKFPLFVAHYETPGESAAGNEYFLQKGAEKLGRSPETRRANITRLRHMVEAKFQPVTNSIAQETKTNPEQLPLIIP